MKHALAHAVQHAACDRDGASSRNIWFQHGMARPEPNWLGNIPQLASPAALSREAQQSQILAELLTSPIGLQ